MTNYTHVQFISWEVYTGPNRGPLPRDSKGQILPWPMGRDGISYTGIGKENAVDNRLDIEGQIEDIRERVQFTYYAINQAYNLASAYSSFPVLRVFMAPEFLYRGKGGAYIHDLINGWIERPPDEFNLKGIPLLDGRGANRFPGLFGYLKSFVADPKYNDWLFVFGTAISASFPAIKKNGGWLVDSTKMGEIYNTALIQRGGEGNTNDAYASRKRYISGIDFINSQYNAAGFALPDPARPELGGVVPADRLNLEPNESAREGSATFTINGINDKDGQPIMFGLEVCLDHLISTPRNPQPPLWAHSTDYAIGREVISPDDGLLNKCRIAHTSPASPTTFTQDKNNNPGRWFTWGRLRTADKWVKIQLVPSGGMRLVPASIRLLPAAGPTPHSYAFNCDGLSTLWAEYGAHTQIWNGANGMDPVPEENQLINANYGQPVSNTRMLKVDDEAQVWPPRVQERRHYYASDLWDLGAGYVRTTEFLRL